MSAAATKSLAMRARALSGDRAQWMARAGEIAERDHLMYRSRHHGMNEQGERTFSSPSRTNNGVFHVQTLDCHGMWRCGCAAGEHGLPCGHVGASAHLWQQISYAMSEAGMRANHDYIAFADWLETRGY